MNAGGPNNIKGAQYVVAAMRSLSVLVKPSNAVVPPAFYNDETNQNITVVNYLNTINSPFNAFAGFDASWLTDVYCPSYPGE